MPEARKTLPEIMEEFDAAAARIQAIIDEMRCPPTPGAIDRRSYDGAADTHQGVDRRRSTWY